MRHLASSPPVASPAAPGSPPAAARTDWAVLRRLLPYLWQYRWRVAAALGFMVAAKLANVGVPLLLKELVDALTPAPGQSLLGLPPGSEALLVVPVGLLLAYGLLRLSTTLFTELRELIFAKATEGATRAIALQVFGHLHELSLRFHLERQTGGMTRDIERGTRGVQSLISYSLYSILPTLLEVALVLALLGIKFELWYVWTTLAALVLYVFFTVRVTEWRTQFRRHMNEMESATQTKAIDSLLNYETVKYFNNEAFEGRRYDEALERLRRARLKSQTTLSLLNAGQQLIIATALVAMLWRATVGVTSGAMTLGDLVMINAFMIQLYIPLNFLGVLYREIKQGLTDLDKMFTLLDKEREIADAPGAQPLRLDGPPEVRFENVHFAYEREREILHGVSFTIPPGKTVAVVGPSGSGKSTLARLLYRFYDVGRPGDGHDGREGRITIAGQDLRAVTQGSVRRAIGIVPQDTVLFNDTIGYNIRYGRPDATEAEAVQAAQAAHIHAFIERLPKGYATVVGERGLKLSGGEKQRVAIARTLLKDPPILIFDEATSALDSANERAIQAELKSAAQNKTTLVIAHRLSTVVDAHEIIVLEHGTVVERGRHAELLAAGGRYAQMWALQQSGGDGSGAADVSPAPATPIGGPHGHQMA
ncbi:ABC transporter ATP-binding protein/permease [Aquabacterium sp. A08]|uniref:ABCB family ABC transporter ATP-binding protein/permease n=1 Tax=Aquabacterium sp. A08 TaxID=2718532 RepID=UPI001420060E|nr:ABC transporter ATP-binding protein/permease [Aquabacterium sp. A08]NIC42223.1 ABC transporter ATP-binding protein/permease [Aquabacterium sp. A08]